MRNSNNIRTTRHCVFNLHAHLVFVTKYRKKIFTKSIFDELKIIFMRVCTQLGAALVEFDGEGDHVHLLVTYPPKLALSKLVNSLKGVSSRLLRKHSYVDQFYWKGVLWLPSFFAVSCGGVPIETLKHYIKDQQTPD